MTKLLLLNEADGKHEGNKRRMRFRRRKVQCKRPSYTDIIGLRDLTREPRSRKNTTNPRLGITARDARRRRHGRKEAQETGEETNDAQSQIPGRQYPKR